MSHPSLVRSRSRFDGLWSGPNSDLTPNRDRSSVQNISSLHSNNTTGEGWIRCLVTGLYFTVHRKQYLRKYTFDEGCLLMKCSTLLRCCISVIFSFSKMCTWYLGWAKV